MTIHSTAFFSQRLAQAFPGQRGLKWYEPQEAIKRFERLFKQPLKFQNGTHGCVGDPVWWFRGGTAMYIEKFKKLGKKKILLDIDELSLNRIAVYISSSYYKSFVYIETKGEKQTGLYNIDESGIKRHIDTFGYSYEEFGLLNGKTEISRQKYDDGATVQKGKVINFSDAELRVRYLSNYNFIVCAKQSPYNSRKFCRETKDMFNEILKGNMKAEDFFEYLENDYEKEEH